MPEIRDSDLDCVSDDTYERIVGRDSDHVNYEQRLEAVIKSTWDGE